LFERGDTNEGKPIATKERNGGAQKGKRGKKKKDKNFPPPLEKHFPTPKGQCGSQVKNGKTNKKPSPESLNQYGNLNQKLYERKKKQQKGKGGKEI